MAVIGTKDCKCLVMTLFLLALATQTSGHRQRGHRQRGHRQHGHNNHGHETRGHETHGDDTGKVQLFYLSEDEAKAKTFLKELAHQSRPEKPGTVSTTWRTAAARDSETAEGVRTAVVLVKQLQDKMEQQEKKLQSGFDMTMEAILEVKNTTEKNDADLQKRLDEVSSSLRVIIARQRCSEAGSGMTYTRWGCFKGFQIKKTWGASKAHCASEGLELASLEKGPTTEKELLQLAKDIGMKGTYWLDLTRQHPAKEWRWGSKGALVDDGSPLWGPGNPQNNLGEDKGLLNAGDGLRDYMEGGKLHFLCAIP